MSKRIICDTNIWYHIAEGKIEESKLEGLNLVLTQNAMNELGSTDLLYKKPLFVREAIRKALTLSTEKYLYGPFDIMSSALVQGYSPYCSIGNKILKTVWLFFKLPIQKFIPDPSIGTMMLESLKIYSEMSDQQIEDKQSQEMIEAITAKQEELQKSCDYINNESLYRIRKNLENKEAKQAHANQDGIPGMIDLFKFMLSLQKANLVFNENPDIPRIDVLLRGSVAFFKDLERSENRNFKRNDWFDMFNLAYINDADTLYWTNDRPWVNLIKQAKIEHVLFELN